MIRYDLTYEQALALPDPKSIWMNGSQVVVFTEEHVVSPHVVYSSYEFRAKFTEDEMTAILAAAYNGDAVVRKLLLKLSTTNGVDIDDPIVTSGVQHLVDNALITSQRKDEILQ